MANSSGHMSHHGAQGTEWTLVAPNELARLASLHPVATRRLPRVQGGRPPTASTCQGGGVEDHWSVFFNCPSSDDLRLGVGFRNGGSGPSGLKVRQRVRGGASG